MTRLSIIFTFAAIVLAGCGGGGGGSSPTSMTQQPTGPTASQQQQIEAAIQRAKTAETQAFSSAARASIQCEADPAACTAAQQAADQAFLAEAAREEAEASTTVQRAERAAIAAEHAATQAEQAAVEAERLAQVTEPPVQCPDGTTAPAGESCPTQQPPTGARLPAWIVSDVPAARDLLGASALTETQLNTAMRHIGQGLAVIWDPNASGLFMNEQNKLARSPYQPDSIIDEDRYAVQHLSAVLHAVSIPNSSTRTSSLPKSSNQYFGTRTAS